MKDWISGFFVAFSLYSNIPMPQTEWNKRATRVALCFLPLVGVVVGLCGWGWLTLAARLDVQPALTGAVAALLPIAITGGIHWDGFVDTCDALCSYGERDTRLAILKDPHVGAFGVLWLVGALLLQFSLYCQIFATPALLPAIGILFVLSRVGGGLAIVCLPCAKDTGLAKTFSDGSDRRTVRGVLLLWGALCLLLLAWVHLWLAVWAGAICAIAWVCFSRFCNRVFGGITGDLAGFFITVLETMLLALCAVGGLILR